MTIQYEQGGSIQVKRETIKNAKHILYNEITRILDVDGTTVIGVTKLEVTEDDTQ